MSTIPIIAPATGALAPPTSGVGGAITNINQDIVNFLPLLGQTQTAVKNAVATSVAAGGDGFHQALSAISVADQIITPAVPNATVQAAGGLFQIVLALLNLIPNQSAPAPTATPVPAPAVTAPTAATPALTIQSLEDQVAALQAQIQAMSNPAPAPAAQAVAHVVTAAAPPPSTLAHSSVVTTPSPTTSASTLPKPNIFQRFGHLAEDIGSTVAHPEKTAQELEAEKTPH
jgi:hypothetical protein